MDEALRRQLCRRVSDNIGDFDAGLKEKRPELANVRSSIRLSERRIQELERAVRDHLAPSALPAIGRLRSRVGRALEDQLPILEEIQRANRLADAQNALNDEQRRLESLRQQEAALEYRLSELEMLIRSSGNDSARMRCSDFPDLAFTRRKF